MGMSYEEKIALSRKIMVAGIVSLLAATLLIILLHLYAKYVLTRRERLRRRAVSSQSFRSDVVVPVDDDLSGGSSLQCKAGLDAVIIASLPKFVYETKMCQSEVAVECSVCLCAVCGKEIVRMLPNCKHLFHLECIDKWLGLHTTCPICRTVSEPKPEAEAERNIVEVGISASVPGETDVGGDSSSLIISSFRKLVTGERSSSRVQSCDGLSSIDLESQ